MHLSCLVHTALSHRHTISFSRDTNRRATLNLDQFRNIRYYLVITQIFLRPQRIEQLLLHAAAQHWLSGNMCNFSPAFSIFCTVHYCHSSEKLQLHTHFDHTSKHCYSSTYQEATERQAKAPFKSPKSMIPNHALGSGCWLLPLNPAASRYDSLLANTNH